MNFITFLAAAAIGVGLAFLAPSADANLSSATPPGVTLMDSNR